MTLIAPAGGVTKGKLIKFGAMVVLPGETKAEGESFTAIYDGIYGGLKLAADAAPQYAGDKAYLKGTDGELTSVASGNTLCGFFIKTDGQEAIMLQGI
ncbi:DUF2190 family protein [Vibrio hannami]|uniref:DUF2190 family protein n=1 Tax=Vibrio hannami TaxID=2717094 RepID=UPI0024105FE7|nr:DUF2190 family protein [Vibrio hannami]MDG3089121.1 DUF2190 family protein [Vibrio hannami]